MLTFLLMCLSVLDLGLPTYGCMQSCDPDLRYVAQLVRQRPLWYFIRTGMTKAEVIAILGHPTRSDISGGVEVARDRCQFRGGCIEFFQDKVERYGVSKLLVGRARVVEPKEVTGPDASALLETFRECPPGSYKITVLPTLLPPEGRVGSYSGYGGKVR